MSNGRVQKGSAAVREALPRSSPSRDHAILKPETTPWRALPRCTPPLAASPKRPPMEALPASALHGSASSPPAFDRPTRPSSRPRIQSRRPLDPRFAHLVRPHRVRPHLVRRPFNYHLQYCHHRRAPIFRHADQFSPPLLGFLDLLDIERAPSLYHSICSLLSGGIQHACCTPSVHSNGRCRVCRPSYCILKRWPNGLHTPINSVLIAPRCVLAIIF